MRRLILVRLSNGFPIFSQMKRLVLSRLGGVKFGVPRKGECEPIKGKNMWYDYCLLGHQLLHHFIGDIEIGVYPLNIIGIL